MPRPTKQFLPADSDPALVAVYRRLAQREAAAGERLFESTPSAVVHAVPGHAGESLPSETLRAWRRRGDILASRHQGHDYFALFQFERGDCKPVMSILRPSDGWDAMFWSEGANVWLKDRAPINVMDDHADEVLEAAVHSHDEICH